MFLLFSVCMQQVHLPKPNELQKSLIYATVFGTIFSFVPFATPSKFSLTTLIRDLKIIKNLEEKFWYKHVETTSACLISIMFRYVDMKCSRKSDYMGFNVISKLI